MKHILIAIVLVSILGLILNQSSHGFNLGLFECSLCWSGGFLITLLFQEKSFFNKL